MPQDNPSAQTATQIKKPLWQRIRYDRLALALSLVFISSFLLYKLSDALIHLPSEKYELAPDNALLYINSNNPASLIDSLQPYQYIPFVHTYSNQLHGIRSLILSKANPFSNKKGILSACFVNPDGQFSILHIIHTSYLFHRDAIKNTVPKYQNPEHLEKRNYKGSIVYEVRLPEDTGVWCFTSIHGHMLISRDPFMIDNYLLRKSKVISKTAAFSSIPSSILKQQVTLILQIPNLQSVQNLATSPVLKRTLSQLSAPNALFAADIQFSEGNILCNGKWIPQSRQLQTIQRILHKHANPKSILACIPADVSLIQSFSIEDPDAFMNDIPSNSTTGKQFFDEWISGNWAFCKLQEDDIFILESKNPELSRKHLSEISKLLPDDSLYYKTSAFNPSQLHNPEFINQTFSNSFFSIKPAFYFSVNNVFYFYSKKSTAQAILESLSNNNVLLNHPNFNEAYRSQTQSANYFIYFNPSITGSWWGNAASTFDSTFFSVSQQLSPFCLSVSNQNGYASAMLRLGPIKSSHSAGNTLWKHTCNAQIISRIFTLSSSSGNEFIAFQDDQSYLHLLAANGQKIWSKWIDGEVINALFEIDCYRNGEKQIAFTTENFFYVIDKEGNYVADFPVKISNPASTGADMLYIPAQERFLFFIPLKNQSVMAYNASGIPEAPWNPFYPKSGSSNNIVKIKALNQKNIVFEYETSEYQSFDLLGRQQSGYPAVVQNPSLISFTDSLGILRIIDHKITLQSASGSFNQLSKQVSFLIHTNLISSSEQNYMVTYDDKQLILYDLYGQEICSIHTDKPIANPQVLYTNFMKEKLYLYAEADDEIFVWDQSGHLLKNFPLKKSGAFMLLKRKRQQDVILIYQDSPTSITSVKL